MGPKIKTALLLAAVGAVLAVPAVANASVRFDPATGTGFVGARDVQGAFGWTKAEFQQNADLVQFDYDFFYVFSATCSGVTTTHYTAASSSLMRHQRGRGGFELGPYGSTHTDGTTPIAGDPCTVDGQTGVWTDVTFIGSAPGVLYVRFAFDGTRVALGEF